MTERVAIFIDGSNFYHGVKATISRSDRHISFEKLSDLLLRGRTLVGIYYYNAPLDKSYDEAAYSRQQRFFSGLRKIPKFNLILCHMRRIRSADGTFRFTVKGDDIQLAVDMLSLAYEDSYDSAVLVSGDGDFVPLIRKVESLGKRTENAYFSARQSAALKQVCDVSLRLDDVIRACLKQE